MNAVEGMKGKCARCHRPFIVRKDGQRYGPTCAKKIAAQEHQNMVDEVFSAYGEQQRSYERIDPNEV